METLTDAQARECCRNERINVTMKRFLAYETAERLSFSVPLVEKPSRIIALANYLVPAWDAASFKGALLWMREWEIGDDDSERTKLMIIDQMRRGAGVKTSLRETPAALFDSNELPRMYSHFVLPLLFGWDAFLVPAGQNYFVFVSHDEVAYVVARDRETYNTVFQRVHDWDPEEKQEWYFRGVSL